MKELESQLKENNGHSYFGGKNGYDYCCFKDNKILCSGEKESMIEWASKYQGVCVGILIPVTFTVTE